MTHADTATTTPPLTAARRSDAGTIRLTSRDITGLVLCGDQYGAPYDLLAQFLDVREDRLRAITARWRTAGYAATARIGRGTVLNRPVACAHEQSGELEHPGGLWPGGGFSCDGRANRPLSGHAEGRRAKAARGALGRRCTRALGEAVRARRMRAHEANVEQAAYRYVLHLESSADANKDKVAQLKDEYSVKARRATMAFSELAHTRVPSLADRIKAIDPGSDEIVRFVMAVRSHRIWAMSVDDWSGDHVPPDLSPDQAWDKEYEARRALIKQVTLLLDLPRPPRASALRRCRKRVSVGVRRSITAGRNSSKRPAFRTP